MLHYIWTLLVCCPLCSWHIGGGGDQWKRGPVRIFLLTLRDRKRKQTDRSGWADVDPIPQSAPLTTRIDPPPNVWGASWSGFISPPLPLHFAGAPPDYGNTKGQAFWTVCAPAVRGRRGAPLPTAQPAHSHSACSVIRCDTKTSLSSSLCQPAAPHWKPDLTAMTLQPDWASDPLTSPSHSYGAQAPPPTTPMQTSGLLY